MDDRRSVARCGVRAEPRPHVPAVPTRPEAVSPPVEPPAALELHAWVRRPDAEDLLAAAVQLEVVVARSAHCRPTEQRGLLLSYGLDRRDGERRPRALLTVFVAVVRVVAGAARR